MSTAHAQIDARKDEFYERQVAMLRRVMGKEIQAALKDPEVENITLNGVDGIVWVNKRGQGWVKLLHLGVSESNALISTVASLSDKIIDAKTPTIEATLPDGNRFTGYLASIASGPGFSIRRRATQIYTLREYVESGTLSEEYYELIVNAVKSRMNIIVAGNTGTGKTTFTNALIHTISEVTPQHRLLIMEDTPELQCASQNSELFVSTVHFSLQDIIKLALRSIPERLIVGEIRDGIAAWALLTAWWTGHAGGVSTLHATNAEGVLERLKIMLEREAPASGTMIASVVNMIIYISHDPSTKSKRRVAELLCITGYDKDKNRYVIERY